MLIVLPVVLLAGAGNPPCTAPATPGRRERQRRPAPRSAACSPRRCSCGPGGGIASAPPNTAALVGSSGAFLPAEPDSFAELSLLDHNPYPDFTFADANALDNLPYGTAIRVAHGHRQAVLVKRDIGYGQGPGQAIPYRLDIYDTAAAPLGVTKTTVAIALAPASGTAATLGPTPRAPHRARHQCRVPAARRRAAHAHPGPAGTDPARRDRHRPQRRARRRQARDRRRQPDPHPPLQPPRRRAPIHYGPLSSPVARL